MNCKELECLLSQDPTVKCPYCSMTPVPEDLEQHVGISHPKEYRNFMKKMQITKS